MYAILTGDLVRSTKLSPNELQLAMAALKKAADEAVPWHSENLRFSRSRGDGWQVYLARSTYAVRTALFLRSALRGLGKKYSTRISIATGNETLDVKPDLNTASGSVFTASGHGLDEMNAHVWMIHSDSGATGAATRLFDHISQGWTAAQARAIHPMLAPTRITRREVAQKSGISRQAVDQALDSAGFAAINDALQMLEGKNP